MQLFSDLIKCIIDIYYPNSFYKPKAINVQLIHYQNYIVVFCVNVNVCKRPYSSQEMKAKHRTAKPRDEVNCFAMPIMFFILLRVEK